MRIDGLKRPFIIFLQYIHRQKQLLGIHHQQQCLSDHIECLTRISCSDCVVVMKVIALGERHVITISFWQPSFSALFFLRQLGHQVISRPKLISLHALSCMRGQGFKLKPGLRDTHIYSLHESDEV